MHLCRALPGLLVEAVESEIMDFLDDCNRRKDICDFYCPLDTCAS